MWVGGLLIAPSGCAPGAPHPVPGRNQSDHDEVAEYASMSFCLIFLVNIDYHKAMQKLED
jgi:hypothetical protein